MSRLRCWLGDKWLGHKWYEANRFYQKPNEHWFVDGGSDHRRSLLANGFTTIEFRCLHCPKVKFEEFHGDLTRENAVDAVLGRMEREL